MRIQEIDYNVNLLQALLWQYNEALRLQSLLEQKQEWYNTEYSEFWENWYRDVFDLRTANDFGLSVWAIILNIPLTITTNLTPSANIWGFGPYPTFTRASSGALYDEDGLLISVGNDVPRYGYDPETLQYIGLLYEAAATNLFTRSESFAAPWGGSQVTTSSDIATAPDGTLTADKVIATAVLTTHYVEDATALIGVADNTKYSYSVYVKKAEYNRVLLSFVAKTGVGAGNAEFRFSDERFTQTTQGTTQSGITFGFDKLQNGWYRIWVTGVSVLTGATVARARWFLSDDIGIFAAMWGKSNTTAPNSAEPTPVAGWVVDALTEDTANTQHHVTTSLNFRAGKATRVEAYYKAFGVGAVRYVGSGFYASAAFNTLNQTCVLDLATGALVTAGAFGVWTVEAVAGGWWKLTGVLTAPVTGASSWRISVSNSPTVPNTTFLGDGVSGFFVAAPLAYEPDDAMSGVFNTNPAGSLLGNAVKGTLFWGSQIEAGTSVTSYIKTTGATATRAADNLAANTSGYRKNFNRGNFAPSTSGIKLTLAQKRLVLQLRYFQLVTRGAIPEINAFLNYVFADYGKVYAQDGLDMTMNYVFTFQPPAQLRFVLESFDVLPRPAAVMVNYVILIRETFGFGPFHKNFNRGNFGSN